MDHFDPSRPGALGHAGTFNNNVLSMAAGIAALTKLGAAELDSLNERGDSLRARINSVLTDAGVTVQATGLGSLLNIHPVSGTISKPADLAAGDDRRRELLFLDLLERGFYIARRGYIALSLAVSDDDLDRFVAALAEVVEHRAELLR
jgi:glutamate-1-semialdehyde 2,1-aminomutase